MLSKALTAASLKPVLLSILTHGEAYGYDILQSIHRLSDGRIEWTAGTLYPVLHRLETQGLVQAVWRPSDAGPRRKYYRLTDKGLRELEAEKRQWLDVHALLVKLWGPDLAFG